MRLCRLVQLNVTSIVVVRLVFGAVGPAIEERGFATTEQAASEGGEG